LYTLQSELYSQITVFHYNLEHEIIPFVSRRIPFKVGDYSESRITAHLSALVMLEWRHTVDSHTCAVTGGNVQSHTLHAWSCIVLSS